MIRPMRKHLGATAHYLILLGAAYLGCLALLGFRFMISGRNSQLSLGWNLFLAAVPVVLGLLTELWTRKSPRGLALPLLFPLTLVWLVFLPNSSYIFTDFIHLIQHGMSSDANARGMNTMLVWYDVVLRSVFAFTGHLSGLFSLFTMHFVYTRFFGRAWGWFLVLFSSLAVGYGVFLGRFIRLNSWNVITHPQAVLNAVFGNVFAEDALFFSLTFGIFVLISYVFVYVFKRYSVEAAH